MLTSWAWEVQGGERPLLLDPGAIINPVEHIEFVLTQLGPAGSPEYWWARPRNGSSFGDMTIKVCNLNHVELRELRSDHFDTTISPQVNALKVALATAQPTVIQQQLDRALQMLNAKNPYVALTYDALRSNIPDADLQNAAHKSWPSPSQVGR